MTDSDKQRSIETGLGTFNEIRPGVYAAAEVDTSALRVPADVSRTGQEQDIAVNPSTVFITEENGKRALQMATDAYSSPAGMDGAKGAALYNNLSLVSSFANVSGRVFELDTPNRLNPIDNITQTALAASSAINVFTGDPVFGPFALSSNPRGGGFVNVTNADASILKKLSGADPEQLNVPQKYIDALGAHTLAHEVGHLNDNRGKLDDVSLLRKTLTMEEASFNTLRNEIRADHASLETYFDEGFSTFMMDMRALGALTEQAGGPHMTHVWAEEYKTGVLPTDEQARDIIAAPEAINERLGQWVSDNFTDDSQINSDIGSNITDRYAYLSLARDRNLFDDIPYGNEFTDKFIAAAERSLKPGDLAASRDKAAENLTDATQHLSEYYGELRDLHAGGAYDSDPDAKRDVEEEMRVIEKDMPDVARNYEKAAAARNNAAIETAAPEQQAQQPRVRDAMTPS